MKEMTKAYGKLAFFIIVTILFSIFLLALYQNADQMFPLKRAFEPDDLRNIIFMSAMTGFGIMLTFAIVVETSIDIMKEKRKEK